MNLSFAVDDDALLLRFLLLPLVLSNSVEEILATARVLNVLDANVDSLGEDTTSDNSTTPPLTNLYYPEI